MKVIITEIWSGTPDFNQGVYDLDIFQSNSPYDRELLKTINSALISRYSCEYFYCDKFDDDRGTDQLNNCRIKDFKYPSIIDGSITIIYE